MVLRICSTFCLLAVLYLPAEVNAARTGPFTVHHDRTEYIPNPPGSPTNYTKVVPVTFETQATTSTGQQVTRYTQRPTPMSPASMGKIARGALTGPWGLAITGALVAADYLVDEQTGEVTVLTEGYTGLGQIPQCTGAQNVTIEQAVALCNAEMTSWWGYPGQACTTTPGTQGIGFCAKNGQSVYGWFRASGQPSWDGVQPLTGGGTDTATDEQIGDVIDTFDTNYPANKIAPRIIDDSVSSGRWRDEWPEAATESDTINDSLENDIEGATNPDTDTTVPDSTTVNPRPVTNTDDSMSAEWPLFCDWATVVCDFIDWVTDADPENLPDPVPLPEREIELEDYDSGIPGTASCPAPIPFNITFPISATYEIELEPVCNLAEAINPFVLLSAYLLSAYILIGAVRT